VTRVHDKIAALLGAELEAREGWDECPQLYRLVVRDTGPELHPLTDSAGYFVAGQAAGLSPVDTLEHFAMTMALVAQRATAPDEAMPTGILHGMAFRHEGWHIEAPVKGFGARRALQLAGEHQLKVHPAREEVRLMVAVDRARFTYQAMQRRGSAAADTMIMPPGGPVEVIGTVASSLDLMVSTLCGVPMMRGTEYRP
jgi:hypothetical protein